MGGGRGFQTDFAHFHYQRYVGFSTEGAKFGYICTKRLMFIKILLPIVRNVNIET